MTTIGTTCMAVLAVLGLAGIVLGGLAQEKRSTRRRVLRVREEAPTEILPKETEKTVIFRRAKDRIVTCQSAEADPVHTLMALGYAPDQVREPRAQEYLRKELAYNLADQLVMAGGIRFYREGDELRAELRALMPEADG